MHKLLPSVVLSYKYSIQATYTLITVLCLMSFLIFRKEKRVLRPASRIRGTVSALRPTLRKKWSRFSSLNVSPYKENFLHPARLLCKSGAISTLRTAHRMRENISTTLVSPYKGNCLHSPTGSPYKGSCFRSPSAPLCKRSCQRS